MEEKEIIRQIAKGKIFIYPTDTIYGLGCDATNIKSVNKIKEIKQRDLNRPMSVIAPSTQWISENFVVDVDLDKYLPGPYTIILKKKNPQFLFHVSNTDSLGIRIPAHEFTSIIQKSSLPFITTSVNLSGEPFIKEISEVSHDILENIDNIIDYGPLTGNPSTLIINGKEVKRE